MAPDNSTMYTFELTSVTRIVFGRGQSAKIGAIAAEFGRSALIVHNCGERGDGGLTDRLATSLESAGLRSAFYRQRSEPQTGHVDEALLIGHKESCDVVIGLGGGSAIDAAK